MHVCTCDMRRVLFSSTLQSARRIVSDYCVEHSRGQRLQRLVAGVVISDGRHYAWKQHVNISRTASLSSTSTDYRRVMFLEN